MSPLLNNNPKISNENNFNEKLNWPDSKHEEYT